MVTQVTTPFKGNAFFKIVSSPFREDRGAWACIALWSLWVLCLS